MRALLLVAVTVMAGCLVEPEPEAPEPVAPVADPILAQTGRWLAPFDGVVPAVNMVLLPDERILYWSGVEARPTQDLTDQVFITAYPYEGESRLLEFTAEGPVVSEPINKMGDGEDLFCSGQTILPDGRVMVAGGTRWYEHLQGQGLFLEGTDDVRIFDPATDTWTSGDDMVHNRWYPSLFTAPDGHPVSASGIGSLTDQDEHWANWERHDDGWSIIGGTQEHLLPLYPRLHVLPGGALQGHAFYSGTGTLWGPFGEHRQQGEWSSLQSYDLHEDAWYTHGLTQFGARNYASSIMLPVGPDDYDPTIISFGGTLQQSTVATALTEIIDASTDPPTTRQGPDMHHARWNHNSLLLPTGEVLTIGGGVYDNVVVHGQDNVPILEAEMWDPEAEAWTELPAMTVPRMYHSSAMLLPDGRVLTGGHVPLPDDIDQQIVETRLEIYEPGYLFRGPRPIVTATTDVAGYGEAVDLQVEFEGDIDSVMLMRPGSTTHAYDSNMRAVYLDFTMADGTLTIRTPPDADVSAPGPHMVFVNGVGDGGITPGRAVWLDIQRSVVA